MKRTLFLLNHRSGSHFMEAMLRGVVNEIHEPGTYDYKKVLPNPVWMKTDPPKQCLFYGVNNPNRTIESIILEKKDLEIPEVYSMHAYTSETHDFIKSLPEADWTIFFIYRDPRNKMESLLKRAEKFPDCDPREKLFIEWTQVSKHIAKSVIECKKDPRFNLVDFDKLFDDPLEGLLNMFNKIQLSPDIEHYKQIVDEWNTRHNSSYNDNGRERRARWQSWTPEEKRHFCEHMGEYLIELGYENNYLWAEK